MMLATTTNTVNKIKGRMIEYVFNLEGREKEKKSSGHQPPAALRTEYTQLYITAFLQQNFCKTGAIEREHGSVACTQFPREGGVYCQHLDIRLY